MKKKVFMVLILAVISIMLLVGCSVEGDTPAAGDGNASGSQEKITWVAQSPWPSGTVLHWMAAEIAKTITETSGGRLTVEMHPAGAMVPAFELLDAVSDGTLDAIHSWEGYWLGRNPAAGFFAAMPLGMNEQEYMTWVLFDEGTELWQECFGDYHVKVLPAGVYTSEIFYHSKVPIHDLDDLKGVKVRGVGFWGDIQARVGASVVAVEGSEVYQSLERGVVDAIEFGIPTDNYNLGYHEVAPYLIVPGIHQPCTTFSFMVNDKKWNELPDDLKKIVEVATQNMWGRAWSYAAYQDMQTMEKYKELADQGKLTIIEFDAESQRKIRDVTYKYYEEIAADQPFFAKVLESQQKFLAVYEPWRNFMTPDY
jgi:TRAP-type mannitol/chloroaromatic compound transport system substrate-binding protein